MKVKAPFAGHPAASSAWLPAATLSLPGSPESHCKRDTATTAQTPSLGFSRFQIENVKKTSRNTNCLRFPYWLFFSFNCCFKLKKREN